MEVCSNNSSQPPVKKLKLTPDKEYSQLDTHSKENDDEGVVTNISNKNATNNVVQRLINDPPGVPRDILYSMVLMHPHLALLSIGNTIIRRDYIDVDNVKILSGGPTGHEPMYSGYVGKGFLSAAIQGNLFSAPPIYHILNLIKELAHRKSSGVLIIIQNDPGIVLNFALAVEKAQNEGVFVKLVTVSDDCCGLKFNSITDQPQGLTGVLLMQKIAGALSEEGESVTYILQFLEDVHKFLRTILLIIKPMTSLTEESCVCRKYTNMYEVEIGGGLHGEGSGRKISFINSEEIATELTKYLFHDVECDDTSNYVLLVNNMCMSKLEESIIILDLIKQLRIRGINILRVYSGTFMTSLDTKAFTVTTLKVDMKVLYYLDHPTDAINWKVSNYSLDPSQPIELTPKRRLTTPKPLPWGPELNDRDANVLYIALQFACDALISCESQLNIMDSECGDGDTGTRIKIAAEDILHLLKTEKKPLNNLFIVFQTLSVLSEKIGGTMGAIYCIIFESVSNVLYNIDRMETVTAKTWLACLNNTVASIMNHTKCNEDANNMVTPLAACAKAIEEALKDTNAIELESFNSGVQAAENAIKRTRRVGRKYPDAGAHSVGIWLRAVYEAVKFRCEFS